jgi:hypothetical protein
MNKLGKQPQRHRFFLNPYEDVRFSRCPRYEGKTRLRKFSLVIHVEPLNPVILNKTCRYCPVCDLIIAHQDEIEAQLYALFSERASAIVGNEYLVMGTVDREVWQRGRQTPMSPSRLLDHLHVFKEVLQFEPVHYGWVKEE